MVIADSQKNSKIRTSYKKAPIHYFNGYSDYDRFHHQRMIHCTGMFLLELQKIESKQVRRLREKYMMTPINGGYACRYPLGLPEIDIPENLWMVNEPIHPFILYSQDWADRNGYGING